jgi:hypothetical protein
MKRSFVVLMFLLLAFAATAISTEVSKKEAKPDKETEALNKEAETLDKDAGEPIGEKTVVLKIKDQYKVDDARIKALRDNKYGYGEISIALALAEKLPGGITDENVNKIVAMRRGPPVEGWGNIAKELGLKLGHVISSVEKIGKESRKEIEKDKHEKMGNHEKGEKQEKHEKPEKTEKLDKTEKVEKPEKVEKKGR